MDTKLQMKAYELLIESQAKKIQSLYAKQDERMEEDVVRLRGTCDFIATKLGYRGLMEYAKTIDALENHTGSLIDYVECNYEHLEALK